MTSSQPAAAAKKLHDLLLDAQGIALAAAKALPERVVELEERVQALEAGEREA